MRRSVLPFVAAILLLFGIAGAAQAKAPDIPPLTGRVVDQANILSQEQERGLATKLAALERKSSVQVVVATLKSLQGRTIEEWGLALGRGWGIGQAGKDNGVILVVAPRERELRIEVGYGLEGLLPDATANAIVRNVIVPRFKAGNMFGGISDGVDAIGRAVAGEGVPLSTAGNPRSAWYEPFVPVLFFAVFVLIAILNTRRRGRRRRSRWYDDDHSDDGWTWGSGGGSWSSGRSSGGGFSGGGGGFGGGGSSGRW